MNWNRETLKDDFSLANSWFKDNREKVFCIGLWLEIRSGYSTILRKKNTTLSPVNRYHRSQHQHHGRKFIVQRSCFVSSGIKRDFYYELLKPGDSIMGDRYRLQLICLSHALREKRPEHRHDEVILLHDNARPHVAKVVKKYLETLKWDVLSHPPYSPDIAPSDYWLFWRMQEVTGSLLSQKSKIGSKIGSPPKSHFFEMEFENCLRDGKK